MYSYCISSVLWIKKITSQLSLQQPSMRLINIFLSLLMKDVHWKKKILQVKLLNIQRKTNQSTVKTCLVVGMNYLIWWKTPDYHKWPNHFWKTCVLNQISQHIKSYLHQNQVQQDQIMVWKQLYQIRLDHLIFHLMILIIVKVCLMLKKIPVFIINNWCLKNWDNLLKLIILVKIHYFQMN